MANPIAQTIARFEPKGERFCANRTIIEPTAVNSNGRGVTLATCKRGEGCSFTSLSASSTSPEMTSSAGKLLPLEVSVRKSLTRSSTERR